MYESLLLRKLKVDWNAVAGMAAAIPGGIQEGQNTGTGNPYARLEITTEQEGYVSDEGRYAICAVVVQVIADNAAAADILTIEQKMQLLLAASKAGTMGGGGGEPTGAVCYAWQRNPPGKSLMTPEERRGGKSIVVKAFSMTIRVNWS